MNAGHVFFQTVKKLLPFLPLPGEKSLEPYTLLIVTKKIKIYISPTAITQFLHSCALV